MRPRNAHERRGRRLSVAVVTGALLMASGTNLAEARPIERQQYRSYTDSGSTDDCGQSFDFTFTYSGLLVISTHGPGSAEYFFNRFHWSNIYTNDQGNGFAMRGTGLSKDLRISDEGDGIIRIVTMDAGQPFSMSSLDGKVVLRDHGMLRASFLVDTMGDTDPGNDEEVEGSFQVEKIAGSLPGFDLSYEGFCAAVAEAMGT